MKMDKCAIREFRPSPVIMMNNFSDSDINVTISNEREFRINELEKDICKTEFFMRTQSHPL